MDQDDCTNVTDSDRYSENRRDRWRYWRCRGGRGGRGGGGDDWNPEPDPTQTTATITSCDYSSQPTATATVSPPDSTSYSGQNASFTGYSQTDIGDQAEGKRTSSTGLIAGLASGVALIVILGVALWWCLRRRRSRQSLSPIKDDARSMEQQQPTYPETQQLNHGMEHEQEPTRDTSHLIAYPPKTVARHVIDKSMSSVSSASLPIQLPTFPSPTPRDRRLSARMNASSSSVPYGESSSIPPQPSFPDAFSGYASPTTEVAVPPNDFYIDMLGLGADKGPSDSNMKAEVPSASAPPSPLPLPRAVAAVSSSSSAPLPVSPRSRSSSIASLKKYSETARIAGASPKLSRDARQMVQQFPPPPPPPQVPPPAIPDEVLIQAPYTRIPRSRTPTTSFEGKEPLHQYWVPTSSGSRPSSYVSVSGRKDGSPARGKKSAARSASLTRKAIDPARRPSPELHPLPGSPSSPLRQEGGPKDKKSSRSHRRSQSNIYAGGSTASMDALDRSLNISPIQSRAPSNMPRPILRQNNSYGGQSSDSNPDVEDIISGALAITAAKKQSDRMAPSVPAFQDKRLYI